jgi:energy coupling factor transporter S component ThiW
MLGTGTLLAFPGSMIGALCCGLMYKYTKRLLPTYIAEVVGTGVLGGLAAYPVAAYLMGREGAIYAYILPFFVSTFGGTLLASILIGVLYKCGALRLMQEKIGDRLSQAVTR